jgi:hypothetical protein
MVLFKRINNEVDTCFACEILIDVHRSKTIEIVYAYNFRDIWDLLLLAFTCHKSTRKLYLMSID